jgi:hypothetical protein
LINQYKVSDLDVIHLVAKTGETGENIQEDQQNTESSESRRDSSFFSIFNRLIRGDQEGNDANSGI